MTPIPPSNTIPGLASVNDGNPVMLVRSNGLRPFLSRLPTAAIRRSAGISPKMPGIHDPGPSQTQRLGMDDMRCPKVNLRILSDSLLTRRQTRLRSDSQPDPVWECVRIRLMASAHADEVVGVSQVLAKAGERMWRGMLAAGKA